MLINVATFVLLTYIFPQYASSNLKSHLEWHPNLGKLSYYYSHLWVNIQYLLSLLIILILLLPSIKKFFSGFNPKVISTGLLSILLVYYSAIAFFNVDKFYPSIRFPNFTSFVKKGSNSAYLPLVTLYDTDGNEINLRKELQPHEIHHYFYLKLNLLDSQKRQNTIDFLENHIVKKSLTVKIDTIKYETPQ